MSRTKLIGLMLAVSTLALAGQAAAQDEGSLQVRPGTANIEGAPGSLQNVPVPDAILGPQVQRGYQVPRTWGHPDFSGSWTNSTMTNATRPRALGTRLILTPQEVATIEGANNDLIARGNASTDPNATIEDVEKRDDCSGGRSDRKQACNYDAGWTAPGDSVMRVNGQPRSSLLTTPDGQFPRPLHAPTSRFQDVGEGGGRDDGDRNDNPETRGLAERCLTSFGRSAVPPMFDQLYNSNYQFQMGKDTVAIMAEMVHDVRVIRLNSQHRTDGIRPWFGDSIGWWDGDTLVVETTNIPERQAYQGSWENLKVTERFTRVSNDRINYQFTIEDPTMWDHSWGGEYEFARSAPPYEYACHEGNYGLEDILAGARAAEAEAAGKSLDTASAAR